MELDTTAVCVHSGEDSYSSATLRFEHVTVRRNGRELLRDVNWTIRPGERWAVLGPNGAGKTTLIGIASAHLHPTSGQAWVLGQALGAVDVFTLRRRIGLSSAALAHRIPDDERCLDVVVSAVYAVVGRWREHYAADQVARAAALLERFGVGHLSNMRYGNLSEGERKRVQICRALMTRPELLLLDEPAAGMDLGSREDLTDMLSAVAQDPLAPPTVHVTHHVEELAEGTSHGLLLADGRVVAAGTLQSVMTSDNLSRAFGTLLAVEHRHGRWFAWATARRRTHAAMEEGSGAGSQRRL